MFGRTGFLCIKYTYRGWGRGAIEHLNTRTTTLTVALIFDRAVHQPDDTYASGHTTTLQTSSFPTHKGCTTTKKHLLAVDGEFKTHSSSPAYGVE